MTGGRFFYLSHAPADEVVRVLYHDLSARIAQRVGPDPDLDVGFLDDLLPAGADWAHEVATALAHAEAFVPLYSPGYLSRRWPLRERESFRRRMAGTAAPQDAGAHIVPVLWVPAPFAGYVADVAEALALADDIPEYADNGLRGLAVLSIFRSAYDEVVDRIASRIVAAAAAPLGPGPVRPLAAMPQPSLATAGLVISVAAPTRDSAPPQRPATAYGSSGAQWRPYHAGMALPVAAQAAAVAERHGLPPQVVELDVAAGLAATIPTVLLVDPWITADAGGRAALQEILAVAPDWLTVLVVVDEDDGQYGAVDARLADQLTGVLSLIVSREIPRARRAEEFERLIPSLIADARRRYLRTRPARYPARPRLMGTR
jgi:FxsC-like protein